MGSEEHEGHLPRREEELRPLSEDEFGNPNPAHWAGQKQDHPDEVSAGQSETPVRGRLDDKEIVLGNKPDYPLISPEEAARVGLELNLKTNRHITSDEGPDTYLG